MPLRLPHQDHGKDAGRVRASGDRGRQAPRARFRPGDPRDAPEPRGEISFAHLQRARGLARATRRAVPRTVRSSDGDDGAVNPPMQIAARSAHAVIPAKTGIQIEKATIVRHLGLAEYASTYQAMRRFTDEREAKTPDEVWVLEHPPVYTVGIAGRAEHFPRSGEVPIERIDRGGQITYHGPGQAIAYSLVDLARRGLAVRGMGSLIGQAVIGLLAARGVGIQGRQSAT